MIGDGIIIFKMHRSPYAKMQSELVIARRNENALWITGYEDRIIYDGRKEGDEKYSPLAKLIKPFLGNFEDSTSEFLEKIAATA